MPGTLVVITGPSGVGKSTIARAVLQRTGATFSVSATTRAPREGEVDGRDYRFVDRRTFQRMIDNGELLEWADVFGELYGTPSEPVRRAVTEGQTVLLDIDVQGGLQVAEKMPAATFVLIAPPNDAELARRLLARATEDDDAARRRLAKAREEIKAARGSGVYNHIVINDDLDRAIDAVARIVEQNERMNA
ncbi:MAG: guanylate kinase [Phycisphaerae bacterium]|nr:guanylate kinase [Phycisphaerae bacterium]